MLMIAIAVIAFAGTTQASLACDEHSSLTLKKPDSQVQTTDSQAQEADPIRSPIAKKPNQMQEATLPCEIEEGKSLYKVVSPPLREKPAHSALPVAAALVSGIAMLGLLRKKRSSIMIVGCSLAALCAAIGFLWIGV